MIVKTPCGTFIRTEHISMAHSFFDGPGNRRIDLLFNGHLIARSYDLERGEIFWKTIEDAMLEEGKHPHPMRLLTIATESLDSLPKMSQRFKGAVNLLMVAKRILKEEMLIASQAGSAEQADTSAKAEAP